MALAMVAEDKQINRVLEELFAEEVTLTPHSFSDEECLRRQSNTIVACKMRATQSILNC